MNDEDVTMTTYAKWFMNHSNHPWGYPKEKSYTEDDLLSGKIDALVEIAKWTEVKINLTSKERSEAIKWTHTYTTGNTANLGNRFVFELERDAVAFKLKWI